MLKGEPRDENVAQAPFSLGKYNDAWYKEKVLLAMYPEKEAQACITYIENEASMGATHNQEIGATNNGEVTLEGAICAKDAQLFLKS